MPVSCSRWCGKVLLSRTKWKKVVIMSNCNQVVFFRWLSGRVHVSSGQQKAKRGRLFSFCDARPRNTASLCSFSDVRHRNTASLYSFSDVRHRNTASLYSFSDARHRNTASLYSYSDARHRNTASLYSFSDAPHRNTAKPVLLQWRSTSQYCETCTAFRDADKPPKEFIRKKIRLWILLMLDLH